MRMVHVNVKPGQAHQLKAHYEKRVIGELSRTQGCRYAGLLQSAQHPDECISLTLWDTEQDTKAYEHGGLYSKLIQEFRPYLLESTESRIQLSQDLTLEYVSVPEEPVINILPVAARSDQLDADQEQHRPMCVRIVSLKLKPGTREEFKRLYMEKIIPKLRSVPGCRYIYLTEREGRTDEILSVTSWDSKEDAQRYEQSGMYDRLLQLEEHVLSELYQWKRKEEREHRSVGRTSDDPSVEEFDVLAGQAFK